MDLAGLQSMPTLLLTMYIFLNTSIIWLSANILVIRRDQKPDGKYDIKSNLVIDSFGFDMERIFEIEFFEFEESLCRFHDGGLVAIWKKI